MLTGFWNGPTSLFMHKYALGILSVMTTNLQNPSKVAMNFDLLIVKSLKFLIEIVGESISTMSPPIIGILQSCFTEKLMFYSLDTLAAFVKVLKDQSFTSIYLQIVALLIDADQNYTSESRKTATYLIIDMASRPEFKNLAICIPNPPKALEWRLLDQFLEEINSDNFFKRIEGLISNLSLDHTVLVRLSLATIRSLIMGNELIIHNGFLDEYTNPILPRLVQSLVETCSKYVTSSPEISVECSVCIGIIGAVDPARLGCMTKIESPLGFSDSQALATDNDITKFATALIEHYLAPSFHSVNVSKRQGIIAFSIQELLKLCGFNAEVIKKASLPLEGRDDALNFRRRRWNSFPKNILMIIEPLLESRYSIVQVDKDMLDSHPIYPESVNHHQWLQSWLLNLVSVISNASTRAFFMVLSHLINDDDMTLATVLLPHLCLHLLVANNLTIKIFEEIFAVLSFDSSGGSKLKDQHQLSLQVVIM